MDKLSGLLAFVKTAELGSFVAAGRALALSASAVGKAVAKLEQELGVRLLQRSTRRMQLTPEGRLFNERCRRILDELDDAQALLSQVKDLPRGSLCISAPIVGHHFLMPLIPDFLARYPEVDLDINFTDRSLDLIDEGIDVAIRSGDQPDSGLVFRPIQRFRLLLCASPAYLERQGMPLIVDDLTRHAAIRFRHPGSGKLLAWPLLASASDFEPRTRTVVACNNIEAVLDATLRGVGIACLPDFLVRDALADGRLRSVLEDHIGAHRQFRAMWPSSRHLSPKVRVFVDFLAERLR